MTLKIYVMILFVLSSFLLLYIFQASSKEKLEITLNDIKRKSDWIILRV